MALGDGFPALGIRHLSDEMILTDVTALTGLSASLTGIAIAGSGDTALVDGMALTVAANPDGTRELRLDWMQARQCLALGTCFTRTA